MKDRIYSATKHTLTIYGDTLGVLVGDGEEAQELEARIAYAEAMATLTAPPQMQRPLLAIARAPIPDDVILWWGQHILPDFEWRGHTLGEDYYAKGPQGEWLHVYKDDPDKPLVVELAWGDFDVLHENHTMGFAQCFAWARAKLGVWHKVMGLKGGEG